MASFAPARPDLGNYPDPSTRIDQDPNFGGAMTLVNPATGKRDVWLQGPSQMVGTGEQGDYTPEGWLKDNPDYASIAAAAPSGYGSFGGRLDYGPVYGYEPPKDKDDFGAIFGIAAALAGMAMGLPPIITSTVTSIINDGNPLQALVMGGLNQIAGVGMVGDTGWGAADAASLADSYNVVGMDHLLNSPVDATLAPAAADDSWGANARTSIDDLAGPGNTYDAFGSVISNADARALDAAQRAGAEAANAGMTASGGPITGGSGARTQGGGLLNSVTGFVKENKELVAAGMPVVGSILKSIGDRSTANELMDKKLKAERELLDRRAKNDQELIEFRRNQANEGAFRGKLPIGPGGQVLRRPDGTPVYGSGGLLYSRI